jgi:hypothetical protein
MTSSDKGITKSMPFRRPRTANSPDKSKPAVSRIVG